jgi:hypothetical protein
MRISLGHFKQAIIGYQTKSSGLASILGFRAAFG